MPIEYVVHTDELTPPIEAMEKYFREGGTSIIQAAFQHSYFAHPDDVKERTPYFPDRARYSRKHYGNLGKGTEATWSGDGRAVRVRLDDNSRAQMAWERYTGRPLFRGSGYGVRHIWGEPWNPDFFTAGWNLCYMPFWAGMLTEKQHPHPKLEKAIKQASWELYYRDNPECEPPNGVKDQNLDLTYLLDNQPILVLGKESVAQPTHVETSSRSSANAPGDKAETIRTVRSQAHQSWSNIRKAVRALQGLPHDPFGTPNVENSAKSCVRKIQSETALGFAEIEAILDEQGW